jgi:hypothetical protein
MMLLCAGVTALITANGSVAALVPVVVMAVRLWRESAQLLIPLARGLAHRRRLLSQRPYRDQPGYSSLRQARGSSGSAFGVRLSRNEWYGATNGSGAITV